MIVVIDTSAAAGIVLGRKEAGKLAEAVGRANLVLAPHLFIAEITNVFWKYHRYGNLSIEQCEQALERSMALPDEFIDERELYKETFSFSCRTGCLAYDAMFLILARRHEALLATADIALRKICRKHTVQVV
jgi:predicted nucleic acid-binding protein